MKTTCYFNKYIIGIIIIVIGVCSSSCKKLLEVDSPPYEMGIADSYKDDGTATSAVMGIYGQMYSGNSQNIFWGGLTMYGSEWAAEISKTGPIAPDDFSTGQLNSRNAVIKALWANAYQYLLSINTAIIQLNAANELTPAVRTELLGECYFMRAYVYFNLVNLWGSGAALTLSVDLSDNRIAASTPAPEIYKQILSDLKLAQSMLPATDVVTDRGRPNKFAATALLARTYLYLGQYSDAAIQAQAVIASSNFSLPAPANVFTRTSKEIIWALVSYVSNTNVILTPDANNFNSLSVTSAVPYQLTSDLYNAFENGDLRKANWVQTRIVPSGATSITYNYPAKYTVMYASTPAMATQSYIILRLAEQYLILAEANYKLNDNNGAITNLNIIRARAGLPALSASLTSDQVRAAIEQENRVEFFVEQGHRFLDLKRWPGISSPAGTRADEVLPSLKFSWKPYNNLWPLPYPDLATDQNLKQNPGYDAN